MGGFAESGLALSLDFTVRCHGTLPLWGHSERLQRMHCSPRPPPASTASASPSDSFSTPCRLNTAGSTLPGRREGARSREGVKRSRCWKQGSLGKAGASRASVQNATGRHDRGNASGAHLSLL